MPLCDHKAQEGSQTQGHITIPECGVLSGAQSTFGRPLGFPAQPRPGPLRLTHPHAAKLRARQVDSCSESGVHDGNGRLLEQSAQGASGPRWIFRSGVPGTSSTRLGRVQPRSSRPHHAFPLRWTRCAHGTGPDHVKHAPRCPPGSPLLCTGVIRDMACTIFDAHPAARRRPTAAQERSGGCRAELPRRGALEHPYSMPR